MSSELLAIDAFVTAILTNDAELMAALPGGVNSDSAPEGTPFPYLIFSEASSGDRNAVGSFRRSVRSTYLFKVVTQAAAYDGIGVAAGKMDELLQRAHGKQVSIALSGVPASVIMAIVRTQPYKRPYTDENGREYRELGGFYRCHVRAV